MKTAGCIYKKDSTEFTVWAPEKETMTLHIVTPDEQRINMQKDEWGNFTATVANLSPEATYYYRPNDENDYPDPASHYQPEGVHKASAVVDHTAFEWTDNNWKGRPFKDLVLYELHVGTFTKEGSFEAVIQYLDDLVETGINALELMPVSQFSGDRNWGYDGTFPYAVQNSYGGPDGLKKLVDACHAKGIAVFLDVVYNHLGPEGNYFSMYGPYFTNTYCTPWGDAINYDGEWSDGVREYFANNALHWFENYHIDGLRLDAIHTIYDFGAVNFFELMHHKIQTLQQKLGRQFYLIAESDFNSPRVVKLPEAGGLGFDAQWLDDFHHSLYVLLDKNGKERYEDFGRIEQLTKAYTDGFVHSGEFVKFRKRRHGASSAGIDGDKFVVFNLNHDQVGNRVNGERLSVLVDFERQKIAAAAMLLSPYVPMLFMGEEYGEDVPFYYFVSHSDEALVKAVREGRKKEFESINKNADPPDPVAESTFNNSKLQWHKRGEGKHKILLQWHKTLLQLRRTHDAFRNFNKSNIKAYALGQHGFVLYRQSEDDLKHVVCLFNLFEETLEYEMPSWSDNWNKILDSKQDEWLQKKTPQNSLVPQQLKGATKIQIPPLSVTLFEAVTSAV